jgi:hypothetical protein
MVRVDGIGAFLAGCFWREPIPPIFSGRNLKGKALKEGKVSKVQGFKASKLRSKGKIGDVREAFQSREREKLKAFLISE